ncbi:MAG: tetratricopeptide repeat protein [Gemmatimonadaceae bacterium]
MPPRTSDPNVHARRVYALEMPRKVMLLALAALCVGGGVSFLRLGIDPVVVTIGVLIAIPGLILASSALRSRLILEGDRLELRSALRTRTVRRDEIDGLRRIQYNYGTSTRIFLKQNRGALTVSGAFTGNGDLEGWLKGLPDVDERNAARIDRMIDSRASASVGWRTHEELLSTARTWMIGLSTATGIACVAAAVPYHPIHAPGMVALLVFPALGIFLFHRFPLIFTTFKAKVDPRADLGLLILLPGLGVLLSVMSASDPSHLVDPTPLTIWYAAVFLAYFGALVGIAWKSPARWGGIFMLAILGIAYSVGLVNAVDTMPDDSSPTFFRTWIVQKNEVHHSRYTDFDLRVASWGPIEYADDIVVPFTTYRRSAVGDPACVGLHGGFLHAAWYTLVPCTGPLVRDAALSVPETARDASALLVDAQREATRHPRNAHAQFVLGECFVQLKRYDEALPPLLAAERLDTTDAWTHNSIGWVLNQQGRFAAAVPHLRAAVALDSTYGDAQRNLGWAYVKLNDLPDAERTYRVVVRLKPKSAQAAYEYAWVLEHLHGARVAEGEIERALQLDPKNGGIQAYAGYLFRSGGRFADARQHLDTASRLLPTSAAVWAELGATDYLMNDRGSAAAAFAQSVRLDAGYVRSRPDLLKMWRDVAPGSAK